jgi:hypothetical protein
MGRRVRFYVRIQAMMLGHLFDEPEADYFASGAWGSSSARKAIRSPQAAMDSFQGIDAPSSSAFGLGTAWDRSITGVGKWAVRPPGLDGRTKEGKAWLAEQDADTQIITVDEGRKIERMRERMPAPLYGMLLQSQFQQVSRVKAGSIAMQARYDVVSNGRIIDLKTTSKPLDDFPRSVITYGYHFQAAWYRTVWALATGDAPPEFWFLVTETQSPYESRLFMPDEEFYAVAHELVQRAMCVLEECTVSGDWTSPAASIATLSLPKWAGKVVEVDGF